MDSLRLTPGMSVLDAVIVLSEYDEGAISVIEELLEEAEDGLGCLGLLDTKHLYGQRIWELYALCGSDSERFEYHLCVELPDQLTGKHYATGRHAPLKRTAEGQEFYGARRFGKPGSFWALEVPPPWPYYEWPIRTKNGRVVSGNSPS